MWGAEGAVQAVQVRLAEALPGKLTELRQRYGADAVDLPDVLEVSPVVLDMVGIQGFPIVMLDVEDTDPQRGVTVITEDGDAQVLEVPYRIRAYVYAMGDSERLTWQRTARYMLAVRELLLERLSLGSDEYHGVIDANTFREDYSDFARNGVGKFLTGASLRFTLLAEETLPTPLDPDGGPAAITSQVNITSETEPMPW